MTTTLKTKDATVKIDTGLDHGSILTRDELLAELAILEADMKAKKKKGKAPAGGAQAESVVASDGGSSSRADDEAVALRKQLEEMQLKLAAQLQTQELEEEARLCVVCIKHPRSHVLLPCWHKCLCSECVDLLMDNTASPTCPMCRATISKAQRVFE